MIRPTLAAYLIIKATIEFCDMLRNDIHIDERIAAGVTMALYLFIAGFLLLGK
jgi:hypothetical protein